MIAEPLIWWHWAVIGFGFIGLELFLPGIFLLWLGFACVGTGLVTTVVSFSTLWSQLIVCAILAFVFTYFGHHLFYKKSKANAFLNKRGAHYVGKTFYLKEPIIDGMGTLNIEDTYWAIKGLDAPSHTPVVIVGIEGNTLIVEKETLR